MGSLASRVPAVIGMPAMMGRVVVLDTGATNDYGECAARLCAPEDPTIPQVQVGITLRLQAFCDLQDKRHVPPLPVVAPSPVIDKVMTQFQDKTSEATWLLDTGGTISLISTRQARRLGLLDAQGRSVFKPVISLPVGGVGQMTQIRVFRLDRLVVPTADGHALIYVNVHVGVHDITYTDPETKQQCTLDGVFGSNLLCASMSLVTRDIRKTSFSEIVIDMPGQRLGLCLAPD